MGTDHWPLHAAQWALVGPPLRPSPEDVDVVAAHARATPAPRVLLLGVTPEIAAMAWPKGATLVAVDRSQAMIDEVWPASRLAVPAKAVRADWRAMPFSPGAFDVVVADGCLSVFAFPEEVGELVAEVHRVLAPAGRFVARVFASPARREVVSAVGDAARAGGIPNFHEFKWRLAMALHETRGGVRLGDVWDAWRALDLAPARAGWDPRAVGTIDVYRGSDARYSFPRLDELRPVLARRFREVACVTPAYELGDRCPTLVLRPT